MGPPDAGAVYELTVVGRVGPVLQALLAPEVAATSCAHLTITVRGEQGADLVDVLQLLVSRGLEATTVSTVP